MSAEGIELLRMLIEWSALPRDVRDHNQGLAVIAAQGYLNEGLPYVAAYNAWFDCGSLAAPLPIPFVWKTGEA